MYNVTDEYKALIKSPVRYTAINGAVKLRDGTLIHITDENIAEGSLSITHKLNGRGDLRPGGVYSGELRAGLKGFTAKTSDLDGAVIRLNFIIYHDSGIEASAAETVPLGRYYVDGSEIKRSGDTVTLSASDAMLLFDVPAAERSGTLYELVCGSCTAAGVTFGMTQAEFEALPNGTQSAAVNTARIQTERDLLMYVGMMTASFARISRGNSLEFVPLTAETDDKNMIIPVREIAANVRFSTEFSDDTTRISRLITRRNGKLIQSSLVGEAGGSEKRMILELNENPLLAALEESEVVSVLNSELIELHKCLTRVFDTDFTGDPALDTGDYVRLRGGMIDTARGYATGIITSQTWHYRGQHTIKCSMPSSLAPMADDDTQAVALTSADGAKVQAAETTPRVQPKSQLEKRMDALEAGASGASASGTLTEYKYLTDTSVKLNGTTYTAEKDESTGLISKISDSAGNEFEPEISAGITDVALHNAVFWAVAMCKGLGKPESLEGVNYRFNADNYALENGVIRLQNQAGSAGTLVFCGAGLSDRRIHVSGNPDSCGRFAVTVPGGSTAELTVYLVAYGDSNACDRVYCSCGSSSLKLGGTIGLDPAMGNWRVSAVANDKSFYNSEISGLAPTVLALRQSGTKVEVFINGIKSGECPLSAGRLTTGTITFGIIYDWNGPYPFYDNGGYNYYDYALALSAHTPELIARNSAVLMRKYKIGG